jgi:hypothetical protein
VTGRLQFLAIVVSGLTPLKSTKEIPMVNCIHQRGAQSAQQKSVERNRWKVFATCPPAEAVLEELTRITTSASIRKSRNLSAFLDFVIQEEIAGRGDRLKAYAIATQALGRPPSFDPALDPIVRVEAARLRRAIERFYSESPPQQVVIKIPVGRYRPDIRYVEASDSIGPANGVTLRSEPASVAQSAPFVAETEPATLVPATTPPAASDAKTGQFASPLLRMIPSTGNSLFSGRFLAVACLAAATGGYLLGLMSDVEVAQQITKILHTAH